MSVSPATILTGFRLFGWLFAATPLEQLTDQSLDELKLKYRGRDWWGNLFGALAFVGLGVGYFLLLDCLATWYYGNLSSAPIFLRPHPVMFGVLAFFLSLTSSFCFVLILFRWILGRDEYAIYIAYCGRRAFPPAPYDFTKVFRLIFLVGFLPLAALSILLVDSYTAFTDRAFIDNSFLSLGVAVEHPYSTVRGVYEVRGYHARFEDVMAPSQLIVFEDGSRWQTSHGAKARDGPALESQRRLSRFVAERSGQVVRQVNFIEDVPP